MTTSSRTWLRQTAWLKSKVTWSWYIKQCTLLGIHYSTWSKHGGKWRDRRRNKTPPVFFFVNEHTKASTKPQAQSNDFQSYPDFVSGNTRTRGKTKITVSLGTWHLVYIIRWYSSIIGAIFFGCSNRLLVHLPLKHRGNVFLVRILVGLNRLLSKGDVAIRLRQKCQYFQGNNQKPEKKNHHYTDGI